METIAIITVAITLVVVFSFIFGEILPVVLPRLSSFFDRKPFNCRPCFTFHLHWLGMAVIALYLNSWIVLLGGFFTAFIVFGIVKILDSKRVVE